MRGPSRTPDGIRNEVLRRCAAGHPRVVRCHPLRRDGAAPEPFPTLFWLTCDDVRRTLSVLESAGGVERLEARLRSDAALAERVRADHDAYVEERWSLLSSEERAIVEASPFAHVLRDRGIGGTLNRAAVKCLHLHYAHHLACGSTLGELIEELAGGPVTCRSTSRDTRN